MTKKRHAKLLRAFVTRVHEYGKKRGYDAPHGKELYKCVYMAEQGLIPKIPDKLTNTRLDWWRKIGADLDLWGMDDIKELSEGYYNIKYGSTVADDLIFA